MAKPTKNRISVNITDTDLDRFLSAYALLPDVNDPTFSGPIHTAYEVLERTFDAEYPMDFITMRKDKRKKPFENEDEFSKTVFNFFKRELSTRVWHYKFKNPNWTMERCAEIVLDNYTPLFQQCLAIALEEVRRDIILQQIDFGLNPFYQTTLFGSYE